MKQKILFVSNCVLNTGAKVVMYNKEQMEAEESLRKRFLHQAVDAQIQLVQLPCPELTLYGSRRWGHTKSQFNNPFFRAHCRKLLEPVLMELEEYLSNPQRFEVLGFIGIDGSPSCGVDYTGEGPSGGSMRSRNDLDEVIAQGRLIKEPGVLFEVISEMLAERGIDMKLTGLFAPEEEKVLSLVK
ncbi:conserved hypothetical protein [uncultured Eubacteriales bacterium]|uniref:DUF523 domain-containing protein n=1 Tax=uncultured Eubacteriales bacterium TaxID=172733 RepID=A0A212KGK3_9FIRM|nr:conserved hypothetical protein [uncultured Eubacteriales bacterium]